MHAYSSIAQIPLQNVAVTVTASDGTAIAMELTDRSGKIRPIPLRRVKTRSRERAR